MIMEVRLNKRDNLENEFKLLERQLMDLDKRVCLLYDDHIYSIEAESSDEFENKRNKLRRMTTMIEQRKPKDTRKEAMIESIE